MIKKDKNIEETKMLKIDKTLGETKKCEMQIKRYEKRENRCHVLKKKSTQEDEGKE
jgi:hypothetical protein